MPSKLRLSALAASHCELVLSEQASMVTGQTMHVSGGLVLP